MIIQYKCVLSVVHAQIDSFLMNTGTTCHECKHDYKSAKQKCPDLKKFSHTIAITSQVNKIMYNWNAIGVQTSAKLNGLKHVFCCCCWVFLTEKPY